MDYECYIIRSNTCIDAVSFVYSWFQCILVLVCTYEYSSSHLLRIFAKSKEEALGAHITHKKVRAVLIAMLLLPNMVIA